MVFLWEVPAGILLRKFVGHSKRVLRVTCDEEMNFVTASESEVKTWTLSGVLGEEGRDVRHSLMINMKEKLIDIRVSAQRLFVLTSANAITYKLYNLSKETVFTVDQATCFTTTPLNSHIYIGSENNNIYEFRVDKEVDYKEV